LKRGGDGLGKPLQIAACCGIDAMPFAIFENENGNRRVASVLRGLLGTRRESLISKGFSDYRTQHRIWEKNQA